MSMELIDNVSQIAGRLDSLTFDDIRDMCGTGRSLLVSSKNSFDKKYVYRKGMMTKLGDIEVSVWYELVEKLIVKYGQETLYVQLQEWIKENFGWFKTEKEVREYSLRLHSSQIFDNPEWVDYVPFNQRYRPEILKKEV